MIKLKTILCNPWVVGIGTTVIAAFVLRLVDLIAGTNMLSGIVSVAFSLYSHTHGILCFEVSVGVVLTCLLIVSTMYVLLKRFTKRKSVQNIPPYLDYIEDEFQGISYRWRYDIVEGKYRIGKLQPYCPSCKIRIVYCECQICGAIFMDVKDKEQLEALIAHGIESKFGINEFNDLGRQ